MTFTNMILSAVLLSSFAFHAAGAQQIARVDYHFGFFDVGYAPSITDITEEDVKGIMCKTQSILTASIQGVLAGMKVKATEIDWSYDASQEKPARIDFTIQVTDQAGQEADVQDSFAILMDAMDSIEINDFLLNLPGFFENSMSFGWGINPMDPVEGKLDQVQCEGDAPAVVATSAPTTPPVVESTAAAVPVAPALPAPQSENDEAEPTESAETEAEPADIDNAGETVVEKAALEASAAVPARFVSTASFAVIASYAVALFL